ncbi:MAG: sigma-70 family RNA polymerase sigma factor [Phycisphaerae bacterium]
MSRLAILYRQHGAALMQYLHRAFGHVEPAEDLLQETLLQAARQPQRLADAVSPRAWLFTIARNVAVTAHRRRRPAATLPGELPATAGPIEDPRLDRLRLAITRLPDHQREPLELRLREELSYEEIAAVLGIPVGTVRSRLHEAVRRLRAALVGEGDPTPTEQ